MIIQTILVLAISTSAFGARDCQDKGDLGASYTGTEARTESGVLCQRWDSQTPHRHRHTEAGPSNHCRNPDGEDGGVWCYTTGPTRWQYCPVPTCSNATGGGQCGEELCGRVRREHQLVAMARIALHCPQQHPTGRASACDKELLQDIGSAREFADLLGLIHESTACRATDVICDSLARIQSSAANAQLSQCQGAATMMATASADHPCSPLEIIENTGRTLAAAAACVAKLGPTLAAAECTIQILKGAISRSCICSIISEIIPLSICQDIVPGDHCGVGCSEPSYRPKTCQFTFTLEQLSTDAPGRVADGGSLRPVLVFNGVLPGPSIVVCQGDNVKLTLKNRLQGDDAALLGANGFNSTTLHFHGIRSKQKETFGDPKWGRFGPWSDGVPLVSQCPIPAGEDFDYSFSGSGGILAEFNNAPAGSYWYHSHVGDQRMNGASGKLIVMPRSDDPPVDKNNKPVVDLPENSLFVQEWYTNMNDEIPVSILVNGKGKIQRTRYEMAVAERRSGENFEHFLERFKMGLPCYFDEVPNPDYPSRPGAQYEVFNIAEENLGKIVRFRIISGIGEETNIRITIEDHTFTAIATDSIDIKETETLEALWISPGERYDILVQTKTDISPNTSPFKMKFFYTYQHNEKTVFKICSIAWLKYPGQTVDENFDNPDCKNWGNEVFENSVLNPIPNNIMEWNSAKFIYPKDLRAKDQVVNIENSLNTHYVDMSCVSSDDSFRCNFNNFQMLYPKAGSAEAVAQSGYPDVPFLFQDPSNPAGRCGSECSPVSENATHCSSTPRPSGPLNCSHVLQQPTLPHQWFEIILININGNGGVAHPIHQHGGWYNVIGQGQFPDTQWPISRETVVRMDQDCPRGRQCLPRNLDHPVFKDVVLVPTNGYVIFRTPLDNPGNWILHCHINFHVEHGMALVLQFGEPEGWAFGPDNQAARSNKNKMCFN